MDRPLDPMASRKRLLKKGLLLVLALGFVAALFGWAPRWLRPTLSRSEIRTGVVDSGPIEATISASGTVVPEFEKVLSSPIDARVVRILRKPGATVRRGDPIIDLDVGDALLSLAKLKQQIALKENQQALKKLELENTLISLRSQHQLKAVDVKSFGVQVSKQQKLRSAGLNTQEELRQALVAEEKAKIELKQLEDAIVTAERNTKVQLEGLALETDTLRKEVEESRRLLDLATTKSDREGVLTWVVAEEGALVRKGDVVARIADLRSFRVDATISDIHATRLYAGLPAKVKIDEEHTSDGAITAVLPTIKDGVVTLQIGLSEKANKLLRSNLRVDVFLVTASKQKALRVKRGPFASGEGVHDVFVVRGEKAVRVAAKFGISSFDQTEIVDGLFEGDEVILSDMKDYMHLKEIKLNR